MPCFAALLIAAIALLATATLVAAALSTTAISTDDAASARAADAADAGVADALERLRWGWLRPDPSSLPASLGPVDFGGGWSSVDLAVLSAADLPPRLDSGRPSVPTPGADGVSHRLDRRMGAGTARRHIVVLSTPGGLPRGLVVGADATFAAPTWLCGCGLCAGGDVSRREWVTLTAPASAAAGRSPTSPTAGCTPRPSTARCRSDLLGRRRVTRGRPCFHRRLRDANSGVAPPASIVAARGRQSSAIWPHTLLRIRSSRSVRTATTSRCSAHAGPPAIGRPVLPADSRIYVIDASAAALGSLRRSRAPGSSGVLRRRSWCSATVSPARARRFGSAGARRRPRGHRHAHRQRPPARRRRPVRQSPGHAGAAVCGQLRRRVGTVGSTRAAELHSASQRR